MHSAILELLQFYRKDLRESEAGQKALAALGVTSASVVEHFQIGYASGKARSLCSRAHLKILREEGLIDRKEYFKGYLVVPVVGAEGTLQDIWGIRPRSSPGMRRHISWRMPPRGLLGRASLRGQTEVVLCQSPIHALQLAQQGQLNVAAFLDLAALEGELPAFEQVEKISLYTKGLDRDVARLLPEVAIESMKLNKASTEMVKPPCDSEAEAASVVEREAVRLVGAGDGSVRLAAGEMHYELDGQGSCMSLRVQIKARRQGVLYLDRCDLGSAASRRTFARGCAGRLQVTAGRVDEHLQSIVESLEAMAERSRESEGGDARELSPLEREEGEALLREPGLLDRQAEALQTCFGYVAEPENKRLALLVAASRLLSKPVSAIVRGPAASGKSALIMAVSKLLPSREVLYFSRITAQSLYFLPREQLAHKLLVCDEYEGLEESEYALRTMMSNQTLSLAITVREGGRVPVTRTVEIPATVAVLVSTTRQVNVENLSRFIELKQDTSSDQTRRVISALARSDAGGDGAEADRLRRALGLLCPCRVEIPFAEKLIYKSGNVLARRQFAQVVGLIGAHAALYQRQRRTREERGHLLVQADESDYEGIYPLLGHVVDHVEEHLTPAAMDVLDTIQDMSPVVTLRLIQETLGWSYSKTYRVLRELEELELLRADRFTAGSAKQYERTPYSVTGQGVRHIASPEAVRKQA